jgi:hypothetical protein
MTLPEYRLQSSNRLEQLGVGLWQALYRCFRVSMSDYITVGYPWKVCCLEDSTICTHPRFLRIIASADSLLH